MYIRTGSLHGIPHDGLYTVGQAVVAEEKWAKVMLANSQLMFWRTSNLCSM